MFSLLEISADPSGTPGITYVVTHSNVIIFTREYTRHVRLASKSPFSKLDIAWGGILDRGGQWVRRSLDFGDALNLEDRERVVELIGSLLPLSAGEAND